MPDRRLEKTRDSYRDLQPMGQGDGSRWTPARAGRAAFEVCPVHGLFNLADVAAHAACGIWVTPRED